MRTTIYSTSKKVRIAIFFSLFTLALFTTSSTKELQIKDKLVGAHSLIHEIEHELSRRRRTEYPAILSFRSKRLGIYPIEINHKNFPSYLMADAKLIDEPAFQIKNWI